MASVTVGSRLGRYAIDATLGRGGMGEVFRATDTQLERTVALKVLRQDVPASEETLARFIRESRLGARLTHANTALVFDAGVIDGTPYIAMEHLAGGSLAERGLDHRTHTAQKLAWLLDAARGLAAAHDQGILHRDMKPNNVLIAGDGTAKVCDFGLGKRTETDAMLRMTFRTQLGFVVGTPKFMAPEQIEGLPVDARADQFAWGLTAYYVLTRVHPRDRDQLLVESPPLVSSITPDISRRVALAINRTLSFDRSARFLDMNELVRELSRVGAPPEAAKAEAPVVVRVNVAPERKPPPVVVRAGANGVVIEHVSSKPASSGVVERGVSVWKFSREKLDCPIAPLVAAAVSRDGSSALAVSHTGLARYERGAWNKLAGLPPLGVADVTCMAAAGDLSYAFGGARGTAFTLDASLRVKKWRLPVPNADRVTWLAVSAAGAEEATFAGTIGGEGVLAFGSTAATAQLAPCKKQLRGLFRDGESLYVCGPRGVSGRYAEGSGFTFFEEVKGSLSAIAATKYGVFAIGAGGWAVRYDDRHATIERVETTHELHIIAPELGTGTLWAVASHGAFLRREGETWKRKSPERPANDPAPPPRVLALHAEATRLMAVCEDGAIITASKEP